MVLLILQFMFSFFGRYWYSVSFSIFYSSRAKFFLNLSLRLALTSIFSLSEEFSVLREVIYVKVFFYCSEENMLTF